MEPLAIEIETWQVHSPTIATHIVAMIREVPPPRAFAENLLEDRISNSTRAMSFVFR